MMRGYWKRIVANGRVGDKTYFKIKSNNSALLRSWGPALIVEQLQNMHQSIKKRQKEAQGLS